MIDKEMFKLDDLLSFAGEFYENNSTDEFMPTLVVFKPDTMDMIKFPDFDERRFAVLRTIGYNYAYRQDDVLGAVFMGEFWIRDALKKNTEKREAFILFAKTVDQQLDMRIAEIDRNNGKLIPIEDVPDSIEDNLLAEFFVGYKLGKQTFSARVN